MRVIIDRFEGEFAICEKENLEMIDILKESIPKESKEGDVLIIKGDKITLDLKETEKRRKRIEELVKNLWE